MFLQKHTLLINAFFHYTIQLGINLGLIDGECIAVDGTIVKAHANNFRLIKIEEIGFLQNLILDYGGNWTKIVFGTKSINIIIKIKNKKVLQI